MVNVHQPTVEDFGREWLSFDQSGMPDSEAEFRADEYFHLVEFHGEGFDLGCGTGRWARFVAPKVDRLNLIDPSDAIEVAKKALPYSNCRFFKASADDIPLPDESQDFGYSLGVLHHIPDPQQALNNAVRKLKPGAPFVAYIYYRFDNRPAWFRAVWRASDILRRGISKLPHAAKLPIAGAIATVVYYPLAKVAASPSWPLHYYKDKSFYSMRTDALDRFGTRLEHRFTRPEIRSMMEKAGLTNIRFSEGPPYWVVAGEKK